MLWTLCARLCQANAVALREKRKPTAASGGSVMKIRIATITAAMLFAGAISFAADASLTGWISDSKCGAKGANAQAGACTTKCVKEHGEKYVFVNDTDKKVYAIDDQDKV